MNSDTEISVKLLSSGRYTWNITLNMDSSLFNDGIQKIHSIDNKLRDTFPDHVSRGSGRTALIDE